ncbi:hypothetical protein SHKM778_24730 [Streptomyces sp. KM77-8]|uniref:ABC transporter ATP-binding protein n=1 Tax=Streptomyces haneummycinicus TaxID=3074435 RepID=A0AAT9HF78_9ACTN
MDKLKANGTTMLYVSHRMPEVFRLADHIQVLRDGGHVASWRSEDTTPSRPSPPWSAVNWAGSPAGPVPPSPPPNQPSRSRG